MPNTRGIRSYADGALEHGKQALEQAQSQLNDVTGKANRAAKDSVSEITAKAADAVNDLLAQAEKAVNLDAIKAAIEPYVAQARGYSTTVTDRAEELYTTVKNDDRVAKLVNTAESVTGAVVETVQDRVVKPAQKLTGRGAKRAKTQSTKRKPATAEPSGPKPATTKAAAKPAAATARKAAPTKTSPTKGPTKATKSTKSTTGKAPAKKATKATKATKVTKAQSR
jgi:hypothetical protein